MTSAFRWGWVVSTPPRPLYPRGKTRYPLYRRLGRPQGPSGRVRKISPPPGFDPRTVQPVASRYTAELSRPISTRTHTMYTVTVFTIVQIYSIYTASVNQGFKQEKYYYLNIPGFWRKHRSTGRFTNLARLPLSKCSMNMCMRMKQRCN